MQQKQQQQREEINVFTQDWTIHGLPPSATRLDVWRNSIGTLIVVPKCLQPSFRLESRWLNLLMQYFIVLENIGTILRHPTISIMHTYAWLAGSWVELCRSILLLLLLLQLLLLAFVCYRFETNQGRRSGEKAAAAVFVRERDRGLSVFKVGILIQVIYIYSFRLVGWS